MRPGALVLARFPDGTLAVKRAVERRTSRSGAPAWWLLSDNPDEGVDSRHRGAVADDQVPAVVVARIWPRPGRPARSRQPRCRADGAHLRMSAVDGQPGGAGALCHTGTRVIPWSDEFRETPLPRRA